MHLCSEFALPDDRRRVVKKYLIFKDQSSQLIQKIFKIKYSKAFRKHEWDFLDLEKSKVPLKVIDSLKIMGINRDMNCQINREFTKKLRSLSKLKLHNLSDKKIIEYSSNIRIFKRLKNFIYHHYLDYVKIDRSYTYLLRSLSSLRELQTLKLTFPPETLNQENINVFTSSLARLTNLEYLNLEFKGLQYVPQRKELLSGLPASIKNLTKLKKFQIDPIFVPKMENFYIELVKVLQKLPSLMSVSTLIDRDPYSLSYFRMIKSTLKNMAELKELMLAISWKLNVAETLWEIIPKLSKLEKLSLMPIYAINSGYEIGEWELLSDALKSLPNLTSLEADFEFCQELVPLMLGSFTDGFSRDNNLASLTLKMSRQELGENYSEELYYFLKTVSKLRHLDIQASRNKFVSDEMFTMISEGLEDMNQLQFLSLNFDQCEVSDQSLRAFNNTLREKKQLEHLSLSLESTQISDRGVNGLAKAFKHLKNLSKLHLNLSVEETVGYQSIEKLVRYIAKYLQKALEIKLEVEQLQYFEFTKIRSFLAERLNPLVLDLVGNDFSDSSDTLSNASFATAGSELDFP